VENNQTKLIGIFLQCEFNINIKNMDGDTPLHLAINHISCNQSSCDLPMALLVKIKEEYKKECISQANNVGDTALHLAIRKGNYNLVEVLLKYGAEQNIANNAGYTPFYLASTGNEQKILNLLLGREYMDCHEHLAIALEDDKLLNYWISRNGTETKNKLKQTPLYFAVINNKFNAVNILLDAKANLSFTYGDKQQTVFHFLASNLDIGATGSLILRTILVYIQNCITNAYVLNTRDTEGNTALHLAANYGNINVFKLLLNAGANSNIPNNDGLEPVNVAHPECRLGIIDAITKCSGSKQPITYLYNMQEQFPQNNIQWSKPLSNGCVAVCTDIIEIVDPINKGPSIYLPGATMRKECILSLSNGNIGSVCDLNKVQIISTTTTKTKIYKLSHGNEKIVQIQELENQYLASVSDKGVIEVWCLRDRRHLASINSGVTSITCFSLYSSGKSHIIVYGSTVETVGIVGTVQVWTLTEGYNAKCFGTLQYDNEAVQCLKLISNDMLVVGFSTGNIRLVDLKSETDFPLMSEHSSAVYCIVSNIYEAEMCNLYSASDDGTIKKWSINFATNHMICIQTLKKEGAYLFDHVALEANIVVVSQSDQGCNVEITNFEQLIAQQETDSLTASQNCCTM
jgi:ankyrin repeat protein